MVVRFFKQNYRLAQIFIAYTTIILITSTVSRSFLMRQLRTHQIPKSPGQIRRLNGLQHPQALLDRVGGVQHVQRVNQPETGVSLQIDAALLIQKAGNQHGRCAGVRRYCERGASAHAPDPRRDLEFDLHTLRSVLKKPSTLGIRLVIALDKIDKFFVQQARAFGGSAPQRRLDVCGV